MAEQDRKAGKKLRRRRRKSLDRALRSGRQSELRRIDADAVRQGAGRRLQANPVGMRTTNLRSEHANARNAKRSRRKISPG